VWLYVIAATIGAAGFSALGFLPWVVGTRWSITDIAYIALSIAALAGLAARLPLWSSRFSRLVVGAVCLALVGTASLRLVTYHRINDVDYMATLGPALIQGSPKGIVIDFGIYPDARYWMEYGHSADGVRGAWIKSGPSSTPPFLPATAQDLQNFLHGKNDRMLFRSRQALRESGIPLPSSVHVVEVAPWRLNGVSPDLVPVALIKDVPGASTMNE